MQIVSLVLCYSRLIFFQVYPRFTRFECKAFLTEALCYFGVSNGMDAPTPSGIRRAKVGAQATT